MKIVIAENYDKDTDGKDSILRSHLEILLDSYGHILITQIDDRGDNTICIQKSDFDEFLDAIGIAVDKVLA